MITKPILVGMLFSLSTAACTLTEVVDPDPDIPDLTPEANTLGVRDLGMAQANANDLSNVTTTSTAQAMPDNGTATYNGSIFTNAGIDPAVVGDLEIIADFDNGLVSGTATNMNVLTLDTDQLDSQLLTGTLDLDGTITGASMAADLTGDLDGVVQGQAATFTADYDVNGEFLTFNPSGEAAIAIQGGVVGSTDIFVDGVLVDTLNLDEENAAFSVCTVDCTSLLP